MYMLAHERYTEGKCIDVLRVLCACGHVLVRNVVHSTAELIPRALFVITELDCINEVLNLVTVVLKASSTRNEWSRE